MRNDAHGGFISPRHPDDDSIPVLLSPAERITNPDRAEALGLTADAARMRAESGDAGAEQPVPVGEGLTREQINAAAERGHDRCTTCHHPRSMHTGQPPLVCRQYAPRADNPLADCPCTAFVDPTRTT